MSGEERNVREVSGVIHHVIFARLNSENIIHPITIYRRQSAQLLPARRRPSGLVVSGVCLCVCVCVCVCVCALFLSARYLKNGFMNHHQIRWVGAGGEPLEEV